MEFDNNKYYELIGKKKAVSNIKDYLNIKQNDFDRETIKELKRHLDFFDELVDMRLSQLCE